jgi:hypothetical protein
VSERPEFWARIDPSGCVAGTARTESVGFLPDDAHKEFTPRIADRRREAAEGWRHELMSRAQWEQRALPCLRSKCGHDRYTPARQDVVADERP